MRKHWDCAVQDHTTWESLQRESLQVWENSMKKDAIDVTFEDIRSLKILRTILQNKARAS